MSQNHFPGTQSELYAVCRTAWRSCSRFLADFTAFKAKYTAPFVAGKQTAIDDAEALPDDQARASVPEALRVELTDLNDSCLDFWQRLKRYIADAFPDNLQKARTEEAGQTHYAEATNKNWEKAKSLMVSGKNFIAKYAVELAAGGNMPAGFAGDFDTAITDFQTGYDAFLDGEEIAMEGTGDKESANNAVYDDVIEMMKDGQRIFRAQEDIEREFVYEQVLSLISGAGTSGKHGVVTLAGVPVPGATVKAEGTEVMVTADDAGEYRIELPSGTYTFHVEDSAGHVKDIPDVQVEVGVMGRLDVELQ